MGSQTPFKDSLLKCITYLYILDSLLHLRKIQVKGIVSAFKILSPPWEKETGKPKRIPYYLVSTRMVVFIGY